MGNDATLKFFIMQTTLFLVKETEYGNKVEMLAGCPKFDYMDQARKALNDQIEILASKDNANETQPTKNARDSFHFYVKHENGTEEKRHVAIGKVYKSSRKSIFMLHEVARKTIVNYQF
jgi:hypothetical protein